jgi:hypothetical protein
MTRPKWLSFFSGFENLFVLVVAMSLRWILVLLAYAVVAVGATVIPSPPAFPAVFNSEEWVCIVFLLFANVRNLTHFFAQVPVEGLTEHDESVIPAVDSWKFPDSSIFVGIPVYRSYMGCLRNLVQC